ncbi:TIGR01777 family oxidoreductase [Paenibacillus gansuensis]|uniref:TIGR01777 family oxidoreductase n=1 Tax=Paenibacillus gansuensis TaxID=306542 RepID=A0ABW5PAM3_9BACL
MKIVLTGGTGFIGRHVSEFFVNRGDEVIIITRKAPDNAKKGITYVEWDKISKQKPLMERTDAVINLAGATINQRWSKQGKERILQSRLKSTSQLAALLSELEQVPKVVINASAIATYGTSVSDTYIESSPTRVTDFLADVVQQWEQAADQIPCERLVKLRLGLVLGKDGGALGKIVLPYRLAAGGRIGSGKQWYSWIHIDDLVALLDYCITHDNLRGPVNATAPSPVTNDEFGRTVAQILRKPHWLPVPSFALKLMLGEMSMLVLEGQRVLPAKAQQSGFHFKYPKLKAALTNLLG